MCKECDIVYICVSVAGSAFYVSITSVYVFHHICVCVCVCVCVCAGLANVRGTHMHCSLCSTD